MLFNDKVLIALLHHTENVQAVSKRSWHYINILQSTAVTNAMGRIGMGVR